MVEKLTFTGFGGVELSAEVRGSIHDPTVLLVHGTGQSAQVWHEVASALEEAGRRVISLDLRGHGNSEWPVDGRYDIDVFASDLQAVLAQLGSRPAIVASTLGGWIAALALTSSGSDLASGLVLVDFPTDSDTATTRRVVERLLAGTGEAEATPWDRRILGRIGGEGLPSRLIAVAANIQVPVMLLRSGLSEIASSDGTQAFFNALPDAEVAEVANARLLIADRRTDELNAVLLDFLERRQPRGPAEYRSGSDVRTLRDALGSFATGVTIVTTTTAAGEPIGLTANSFTSVSLDPPLLLVCIANTAGSASAFREADFFAVNVLQIGQQPASNRFAMKDEDRFAKIDWSKGEAGCPILTGSLSAFECRRSSIHDGGDHFILVGCVQKATFEPRRDPLLYFRGRYRRLHFA